MRTSLEPVHVSLFSERRAMDNWPPELLADERMGISCQNCVT